MQEDFYGQVCELNSVYMCVSSLCRDAFVLMTKDKDGSLVVEVIQMSWAYWGGYTFEKPHWCVRSVTTLISLTGNSSS